ncbi:MAG: hypothetical protein GY794_19545, partial [bacterium]|nr:hypothetical protein [bacterium]
PVDGDFGAYPNIIISVFDPTGPPVPLSPAFTINVLDQVAPVAGANLGSGNYNTSPINVNLTCSDNGSGPGQIFYTFSGGVPNIPYTGTLPLATDATLDFRCLDIAGNTSNTISRSYNIDLVDPILAVDIPGGAYNGTQNINLSCTDTDSGPGPLYFTVNGPDPVIGTPGQLYGGGPIPVSVDSTVKFVCADLAGNAAPLATAVYNIDLASPTVSANVLGGPYNATQNVTLICNDADSGPGSIFFTNDGSDPASSGTVATFSGPIPVNVNTLLRFYCDDLAGNSSVTGSEDYIIDLVNPVNGASPAAGSYSSAQNVTLSCNDAGSGPGPIYYTLNGSPPTTLSTQFSAPIGVVTTTTIRHFCQDLAGNSSNIDDRLYTIDAGAPSVLITAPLTNDNFEVLTTITGTASDDNSVASVEVEISGSGGNFVINSGGGVPALSSTGPADRIPAAFAGGSWSFAIPFNWPPDVYTVRAFVTDNAANESFNTVQFSSNRVPTISGAPSVTLLQPGVLFSFTPTSGDADVSFGDSLTFSIQNQPSWATGFNTATGELSGTPADGDFGSYPAIIITATDEFGETASLGSFTLDVTDTTAPVPDVDVVPGSYNSNVGITLSCNDTGSSASTIYFTTNGTNPVAGVSPIFSSPVVLTTDTTIKYICRDSAGNDSSIASLDYVFDQQAPLLTVVNPTESDFINELASITGTAGDNDNLASVELEIAGASGSGIILSGGSPVVAPGTPPQRIPTVLNGGSWSLLTP